MENDKLFFISAVIFFAFAGLVLRNFPFSQGNLDKTMPPVITSYDVFANTEQTKWIYDSEQAYYYNQARTGGIEGVIGTHPTLYYIFIATFTKLTTLPVYQTAYLTVNILSILIILQLFAIFNKLFGAETALVALAIGTIPAHYWLFPMYVGFQYDYFTFATIPTILFLLVHRLEINITRTQRIMMYTLFGFLFIEQFLGHYVELIFYAPFFAALPLFFVWKKTITIKEYTTAIIVITLIMTPFLLYFLPLTIKDHLKGGIKAIQGQVSSGEGSKHVEYFPWPRFDFWLNIFSIIGIFTIMLNFKRNLQSSQRTTYLLFLVYLIIIGFSNVLFNISANRAERQLFQGYPFLVLLPALGITIITELTLTIIKKQNMTRIAITVILTLILLSTWNNTYNELNAIDDAALVDDNKWQSVVWIRDNTPKDSRVFFLSGFEHEFSMLSERVNLKGDLNRGYTMRNIKALCQKTYPEEYFGEWALREYGKYGEETYTKKRTGITTFEDIVEPFQNENEGYIFNGPDRGNQSVPLKFFDYVVLQYKGTGFDHCGGYFINQSLEIGHTLAWFNDAMAIIKINRSVQK
ncbi:hypothetical protein HY485_03420 [Candidatus Woesearchaeota archaeon]|nr:hypothetical protein [Candidatus Woesearchaeota archaeon]